MKNVAFICVHNSCRSQIAEALGRYYGKDIFNSYSAGTELKDRINPDAVRLMKELYGIDMEEDQRSKLISDLDDIDIDMAIKMGCNVVCPYIEADDIRDWGLDDPSGQDDEVFKEVIGEIDLKVKDLVKEIKVDEI